MLHNVQKIHFNLTKNVYHIALKDIMDFNNYVINVIAVVNYVVVHQIQNVQLVFHNIIWTIQLVFLATVYVMMTNARMSANAVVEAFVLKTTVANAPAKLWEIYVKMC